MTADAPEPDPTAHQLSAADHLDIFQTVIVPAEFAGGISQEQPRVLLLGGQTGAGKSVMKGSLTADSRWDQALEFGSDTLRVYHPDYKRLLKVDADRACFYTDPDARAWVEDSLNHCLAKRFSVVFDSTLSRPHTAESIATRFRQASYRLEAAFVAAPAALSRLGVVSRYLASVEERENGRFSLNHDETYAGVLAVADWVDRQAPFDTVSVYRRSGENLYFNEVDASGNWTQPPALRQTIEAERSRVWTQPEAEAFLTAVRQAFELVDTLTIQDEPLEPIWLTRIADAAELATPLVAGASRRDLADTIHELRQKAEVRGSSSETSPTGVASPQADPDVKTSLDVLASMQPDNYTSGVPHPAPPTTYTPTVNRDTSPELD